MDSVLDTLTRSASNGTEKRRCPAGVRLADGCWSEAPATAPVPHREQRQTDVGRHQREPPNGGADVPVQEQRRRSE